MAVETRRLPDRNIAMELVRVTEAAALAAATLSGHGSHPGADELTVKNAADALAVDAMRLVLNTISMDGIVVIGEGAKDDAPMLYNGELIGDGREPKVDIAVDPIDGTTLTAKGLPGAVSVIALSERGSMFNPGELVYMDKLIVGPQGRGSVDIDRSPTENLRRLATHMGKNVGEIGVMVLNRPRHEALIREIREAGARLTLIQDGDVGGAISTSWPGSGIDILFGIGGTPEGVIAAAALKGLGGEIQGRLHVRNDEERRTALDMGLDITQVLTTNDLVRSESCFFAMTAITDGDFLRGIRFHGFGATSNSLVIRSKTGTVRIIETIHRNTAQDSFVR